MQSDVVLRVHCLHTKEYREKVFRFRDGSTWEDIKDLGKSSDEQTDEKIGQLSRSEAQEKDTGTLIYTHATCNRIALRCTKDTYDVLI